MEGPSCQRGRRSLSDFIFEARCEKHLQVAFRGGLRGARLLQLHAPLLRCFQFLLQLLDLRRGTPSPQASVRRSMHILVCCEQKGADCRRAFRLAILVRAATHARHMPCAGQSCPPGRLPTPRAARAARRSCKMRQRRRVRQRRRARRLWCRQIFSRNHVHSGPLWVTQCTCKLASWPSAPPDDSSSRPYSVCSPFTCSHGTFGQLKFRLQSSDVSPDTIRFS